MPAWVRMTGMETTYAYRVVHAGIGRGWFVVKCGYEHLGDIRTVSGPYTTKAQAELKARALEQGR